jgi:hypothetical protein
MNTDPDPAPERRVIRNIALRRAVLRILLRADAPVSVSEIVRILEDEHDVFVEAHREATASQRISNLLGWQARQGRVRRVRWGTYVAVPDAIPRTTRWRIDHWDELD